MCNLVVHGGFIVLRETNPDCMIFAPERMAREVNRLVEE